MEIPNSLATTTSSIVVLLIATALLTWTWRVLEWVWFRPKKLERQLRQQGLGVQPYRLFHGDLKEVRRTGLEATLTPMPDFSHDYFYRIRPFLHRNITKHGKVCVTWDGPVAMVNVGDAEMVKEVLLKNDQFLKPKPNPLTALLARGVATYDGHKWAQHRKLINPAFHMEKLKVLALAEDLLLGAGCLLDGKVSWAQPFWLVSFGLVPQCTFFLFILTLGWSLNS